MFRSLCKIVLITTLVHITITTAEDYSTTNSINESLQCPSNVQLKLIENAVVTQSVQNVLRKQFDNVWDIFNKINLNHGPLIDKIVERALDTCIEGHIDKILEFMNYTSNVQWKRIGYQAIFNEINSNSNLSSVALNWLSIQHFVSHDELTAVDPELTELLNQIESITNVLLESPDFELVPQVRFDNQICIYDVYFTRKTYLEYAIKRMSSNNPIYIARLWKALSTKGHYVNAKVLSQFISTLEQGNRLNYTIMTLPYIKKSLTDDCTFLKDFKKTFPRDTILGSLLVPNQHFYIKSVHDDKYLCYWTEPQSNNKENRPMLCSNKNSTWLINPCEGGYISPLKFKIESDNGESIYLKKCHLRNEWYTTFFRYAFNSYQAEWDFEVYDIYDFRVRIKLEKSGQYLRVGNGRDLFFSELDEHESSKFEWLFEGVPNNIDNSYAYHRCN